MTIIFRVIVGVICDILGPRRGLAFLLFLACPGILGMMSAAEEEWMAGSEGEATAAIPIPIEQGRVLQRDIPLKLLAAPWLGKVVSSFSGATRAQTNSSRCAKC